MESYLSSMNKKLLSINVRFPKFKKTKQSMTVLFLVPFTEMNVLGGWLTRRCAPYLPVEYWSGLGAFLVFEFYPLKILQDFGTVLSSLLRQLCAYLFKRH